MASLEGQRVLLVGGNICDLSSDEIEEVLENRGDGGVGWWWRLVAWESRLLWQLSAPSIVVSVANYMLSFVTLMFTGHLGALELAGASIASVVLQGLAYGIMLGMASAVQTVCGQAYGTKKYAALGIICQRSIVLLSEAALLLTFLYYYSGAVLKAIGQSESIAEQGQVFARGLIPQLFAFAISCPMQRFLQAQNIVNPLAYMSVGVLLFHILLTWLGVYVLKYGLLGASLSLSLSWWFLVIANGLYIVLSPSCKETWTGLSLKAFKGIWPFFKITAASAVMLCLEKWYNQGLVLISGLLPNPTISLDSISICMNYWNWDINFMLGLSAAASVRVSNELGAGHPRLTKFSVIVVNFTSISISVVFSAIAFIFRVGLSQAFTSDAEVIEAVSNLTPLLAISIFLNGIQPILSGVAIGSGWQHIVAYVNLTTYYIIGLPIACLLGFKTSLGVAFGMATAVQTVCGQSYGAKKYAAMGIVCQRAMVLHLGPSVVLSILYIYSGTVLKAIGQSDSIAEKGQILCRGLIPQLFAFALSLPMQRFLQAQNIVNPLAFMAVGVFLLHILHTWLVIYILGHGLLGASLTLSVSWWLLALMNWLYIVLSPSCKETWTGLSLKAFKGIWPHSKLAAAAAVMLCLGIWYSQGLVLISGLLPNPKVSPDSISICMNYWNWDINFVLAISIAASVRVSIEIGAGHPRLTKFAVIAVMSTSIFISIVFTAIILIFQVGLSEAFTSDDEKASYKCYRPRLKLPGSKKPHLNLCFSRVAIGSGWQDIMAYVNLTCYYIIGLPIACVLGFKTSLGVVGMWWGMIFGIFLQTIVLIILTIRTNRDNEVEKAADRLKKSANVETLQLVTAI